MPALSSNSKRNVRCRNLFAWGLSFGFAGLTLIAAAQSPAPGQNSDTNGPVVIPPDAPIQPQPAVQPQPPPDAWDRFWKIEKVTSDDEWTRHFRLGAIVGLNISASFNLKNNLTLSGGNAAQGNYDDGYVRPSGNGPYTSDWGYDQTAQYNAATHRLMMHQATSFSPDAGASVDESGSVFPGFDLAYGGNLWVWGDARIGWEFGFGLLPINITGDLSASGNVNQNVFEFDTSGIDSVIPFPVPGYRGGPGGTLSIPSDPVGTGTDTADATIEGTRTLDVILYTFRLGPTLYWDLNEDLALTVGAGPAVGIVSGRLDYDETITTATTSSRNRGQVDATDVVYGGYVNAMLTYHVEKNGDLYVGVQYMPMSSASISGGGREARLNLDGQVYITAGINWPF